MKKLLSARARKIEIQKCGKRRLFCLLSCALFIAVLFTALTSCNFFDKGIDGVDNGGYIDYNKTYSASPISGGQA